MKKLATMVNTNKIKAGTYSAEMTSIGEPTDQDKKFINDLFNELAGIFPAWKQAFDGTEGMRAAKRNWMAGLIDAGINEMGQIQNGLRKARKSENPFMPSVGQFIGWCNVSAEDIGLPSLENAWDEIIEVNSRRGFGEPPKPYSHGIIYAATNDDRCDIYNWRLLSLEKGLLNFKSIYQEYVNQAVNGEEFKIPVMIEDKKDRPVTREECKEFANKHLDALKNAVK